jgi:hypothetical protein
LSRPSGAIGIPLGLSNAINVSSSCKIGGNGMDRYWERARAMPQSEITVPLPARRPVRVCHKPVSDV